MTEAGIWNFRPLQAGMQHHGADQIDYGLNGAFSNTILMVCTNTVELDVLFFEKLSAL